MRRDFDSEAIEARWLKAWADAKVYDAKRGEASEKKFFLHFAYPGISGYLHVGHMRGFTYSDVFCRFHRMTGHRVLFPAGFHASGIPSVGLARRVERGDPDTIQYLQNNGTSEEQIAKLRDPKEVVRYFSHVYRDDYWRRFGFLIDWRTLCTTIDPGYMRFIEWQFRQLHAKDLLVVKPHFAPFCPLDGAIAVDASETDILRGGNAEVLDFTLVGFELEDGSVLPCATLRPETVWGVTNLWVNPTQAYRRVRVGNQRWILAEPTIEKLRGQRSDLGDVDEPTKTDLAKALLAQKARNPLTREWVPILPADFVEGRLATGLVMSVPAHAPYDWQALHEVRPDIQPKVIIDNPKTKGVPAEEACRRLGVKSQEDKALLDKATEEVYSEAFHQGTMASNCGPTAGMRIPLAQEKVKELLRERGLDGTFQDFSERVVCRCGRDVAIRQIPDQWFIRYSDGPLTERSKAHAATMRIFPDDYHRDMPAVLDWFGDRACIRRGSWLGTEFPFKPGWIIEPIADSTLYPAYYIVSPYVNDGRLKPEELDDAFFDFVFLGKGQAKSPSWKEVRSDFDYWYPADINLGGKEHKTVHFPPYLMNHVAIFPPERRPKGIFVNWWVTQKAGEKISKSKGGAEPIPGAAKAYGVDAMRLYYSNVASPHVDIEWDPEIVLQYRAHVERIFQFCASFGEEEATASSAGVDEWLEAAWRRRWDAARKAFEDFDLRTSTQQLYFEFYNDLQWFRRRGGRRNERSASALREWVLALAPVTPFVGEELWKELGGKGLASVALLPSLAVGTESPALAREDFLRQVLDDVGAITKVTRITPKTILIYTAPAWKRSVASAVRAAVREGERNVGVLIKAQLSRPEMKPFAKDVSTFVQRAFKEALERPTVDGESPSFDEFETLLSARPFLAKELSAPVVEVFRADDPGAPDPGNKRQMASPLKPALYIEG